MRKKEWNPSVYIPNSFENEIDHKKKLLDIRIGLQNQKKNVIKDKNIPEGCDSRNKNLGWNVSNKLIKKEMKNNLNFINSNALMNTMKKTENYLNNYINPIEFQNELIKEYENEKLNNKELMKKLKEKYIYQNPDATEEKIVGGVFKMFKEYKHKLFQDEYLNNLNDINKLKIIKNKNTKTNLLPKISMKNNELPIHKIKSNNIEDIMRNLQLLKKQKKNKKKLIWVYENC